MTPALAIVRDDEQFFRVPEIAARWRVSISMVRKQIRSGRLPVTRIGRTMLIARSDANAFLAQCRRGARP